ncbi:MAG: GAF domain-containing protein [Tahibacter sp.]
MNAVRTSGFAPLAELLDAIAHSPPLPELLEHILDAACRLVHADAGVIGQYESNAGPTRVAAVRNLPGAPERFVTDWGDQLGHDIRATRQRVQSQPGEHAVPEGFGLPGHEVLGIPIRWREELLGFIGVSVALPRRLRDTHIELLELIARIAAVAIEHSMRQDEVRRRSRRFEVIARIAAGMHQDLALDALLQRAADTVHELLQFPNVDIPLIDPLRPDTLVIKVRGGSYKDQISHEDRIPIDSGIMGAAVREQRSQLVNDVAADSRYVCPPGVIPARAELAVPIHFGDEVLGVLNVESNFCFDDFDRSSLEVVADCLAVTIRNARLFSQSREGAVLHERARLARELHDNVTQILSSISLLAQTLVAAWQKDPAEGERRAGRLHQLSQTAFAEMRMLLRELSPPGDPAPAISRQGRSFAGLELLRSQALPGALSRLLAAMVPESLELRLDFGGYTPQDLDHEEALYRVAQEAVSNVIRHAQARRLRVEAAVMPNQAVLRITDNGRGMGNEFRPGLGLSSMRTRIEGIRGTFRISPNTPSGTLIEVRLPRSDRIAISEQEP